MTAVQANPPRLEVTIAEKPEALFMSYGLLNRLAVMLGGPEGVAQLAASPEAQEQVLLEVFTKRNKSDVTWRPTSLDEIEVSLDDLVRVLDWVGAHITDFFLKVTERTAVQVKAQEGRLRSLQAIASGMQDLTSKTPAA